MTLAILCGEAMIKTTARRGTTLKDGTAGIDPQTETDVANERLIMEKIAACFPAHAVIGEEATAAAGGTVPPIDPETPTWVVDPIDGTQNFCHGLPESSVSIGLCLAGTPALGVIYDPYRDELYVGIAAEGLACVNGVRLPRVDPATESIPLDKALCLTDVGYERSPAGTQALAAVHQAILESNVFGLRIVGTTVLSLAWLAAGRCSAVYMGVGKRDCPKAWDWAAAWAINMAVGIKFGRLDSDQPFVLSSPSILAARSESLARTLRRTLCTALVTLK